MTTLPTISAPPLLIPVASEIFALVVVVVCATVAFFTALVLAAAIVDVVEVGVTSGTIAPPKYQLPIFVKFPFAFNMVTFLPTPLAVDLKDPK